MVTASCHANFYAGVGGLDGGLEHLRQGEAPQQLLGSAQASHGAGHGYGQVAPLVAPPNRTRVAVVARGRGRVERK